jgi:hypothetical protein
LVDSDAAELVNPLPLTIPAQSPMLTFLRRLRFLGIPLPLPQALHWGVVATYRVRVSAIPESSCGAGACFEAVLLDDAPAVPGEG